MALNFVGRKSNFYYNIHLDLLQVTVDSIIIKSILRSKSYDLVVLFRLILYKYEQPILMIDGL